MYIMGLGNRLECILNNLMNQGCSSLFADIGSDHAFLAIEAVKRGYAKSAIASDINPSPLKCGFENAKAQNIHIDFVLSDGFDAIESRDISSAAICGMGGELIAEIVGRSEAAKKCILALQPMNHQQHLRKFLWENGFEIINEDFCVESSKPYCIIIARYTGINSDYTYSELFIGKNPVPTHEFIKYTEKVMSSAKKRLAGQRITGADTSQTEQLICECQTQITNFSAGT